MADLSFHQQGTQLPVVNFDHLVQEIPNNKRHGHLLPSTVRALIVGPSACGKSNALLSLLTHPNGLRFENIYVYCKSLNQKKYVFLKKLMQEVGDVGYFEFAHHENVISPDEALPNSVFIFDDVACEPQVHIRNYFCMGRHKNVDAFYLCQSYSRIPKHLIRDNCNFLVIFKQDVLNLRHIYDDHVGADLTFNQFKNMASRCWSTPYGFLVVDKDSDISNGRFRRGFDCFISINSGLDDESDHLVK